MSTEPEIPEEKIDPSPYIRTFAKDFAVLAAKNPEAAKKLQPKHPPKPPKPPKQEPAPKAEQKLTAKGADTLESELDENASQMQKQGVAIVEKQSAEPVDLPAIETGDIVTQPTAPVEPNDEEREAILARLKARVATHAAEAPAPVAPPPAPVEVPIPVPIPQKEESSPIHTYTSDFADQIDAKHASKFSVLAAEKDAPKRVRAKSKSKRGPVLAIIAGVVLILAGASGVFVAYVYMTKNAPVSIIPTTPSLIPYDSKVLLSGSGTTLMRALADKTNTALPDNNVLLTYVDESTTTPQGTVEEQASGGAFITELNLPAPDILLRNIDPSSMVGIVHVGAQTRPFFILRVTSYERTFAGMLQWEPSMFHNLQLLYPLYPEPVVQTPVTVSTSTTKQASTTTSTVVTRYAPVSDPSAPAAQFVDEIVANRSARALKDNAGRTIVLYGYADQQTLIIARDEASFTLLLGRLAASRN